MPRAARAKETRGSISHQSFERDELGEIRVLRVDNILRREPKIVRGDLPILESARHVANHVLIIEAIQLVHQATLLASSVLVLFILLGAFLIDSPRDRLVVATMPGLLALVFARRGRVPAFVGILRLVIPDRTRGRETDLAREAHAPPKETHSSPNVSAIFASKVAGSKSPCRTQR